MDDSLPCDLRANAVTPRRLDWSRVVGCGGLVILFLWAYAPTLHRVVTLWSTNPDYGHGYLVVPLSIAIWWRRRAKSNAETGGPVMRWLPALGLLALAGGARMVAARFYLMPLDDWSIPVWCAGAVWLLAGRPGFIASWPAIAFLCFALPLPPTAERWLSGPLQLLTAQWSSWALQAMRQPAVAAGSTVYLGSEVLEVERACSGLRMFFGTLAMIVAYVTLQDMFRGAGRRKALLLLGATMPIAMTANTVRIVLTGLSYRSTAAPLERRVAHDFAGLLMVLAALALFSVVLLALRLVESSWHRDRGRLLRRLAVAPLLLLSIGVAVWFWHARQLPVAYQSLLDQASRLESSGQWDEASVYLQRYLSEFRHDAAVHRRLAYAHARTARSPREKRRALRVITEAWHANPADWQLAEMAVRTALELRQRSLAIEMCEQILASVDSANSPPVTLRTLATRWRAQATYELLEDEETSAPFGWQHVAKILEQAIEQDGQHVTHYFRLACLYRDRLTYPSAEDRKRVADQWLDRLVSRSPRDPQAWLARYQYRRRYPIDRQGSPAVAKQMDEDLRRAAALDSQSTVANVHVLVAVGDRARERGELQAAKRAYEAAIEANPRDVRSYLAIAQLQAEHEGGQGRRRAIETLSRGLRATRPGDLPLAIALIEQLSAVGDLQEADLLERRTAARVSRISEPAKSTYRVQLAHVRAWRYARQGDFDRGAVALRNVLLSLTPRYLQRHASYVAEAWVHVARYEQWAGRLDRSVEAYRTATVLDPVWHPEYQWAVARHHETPDGHAAGSDEHQIGASTEHGSDAMELQTAHHVLRQQATPSSMASEWTPSGRTIEAAGQPGAFLSQVDPRGLPNAGRRTVAVEVLGPHLRQMRIAAAHAARQHGRPWEAASNYQEAWRLGPPQISLAVDLIEVLNELGQTEQAQQYVDECRRYLLISQPIVDGKTQSGAKKPVEEAVALAESAMRDHPSGYSCLRLARTLLLTAIETDPGYQRTIDRAESVLRRAVELAPEDPRTWGALFRFQIAVRSNPVEAYAILQRLQHDRAISPVDRVFALAQLAESIDDNQAAALFRKSIDLAQSEDGIDNRVIVLQRAAQYFIRRDRPAAESCCRRALRISPGAIGPKQILAQLLIDRGDPAAIDEAASLIDQLRDERLPADTYRRLRARVEMARADKVSATDAIRGAAIEQLQGIEKKTADDALRLSELYLAIGQIEPTAAQLDLVLSGLPSGRDETLRFLGRFDSDLDKYPQLRRIKKQLYDRLELVPDVSLLVLDQRLANLTRRSFVSTQDQRRSPTNGRPGEVINDPQNPFYPSTAAGANHVPAEGIQGSDMLSLEVSSGRSAALVFVQGYCERILPRLSIAEDRERWLVALVSHLIESGRGDLAEQSLGVASPWFSRSALVDIWAQAVARSAPGRPEWATKAAHLMRDQMHRFADEAAAGFRLGNIYAMAGDNHRASELYALATRVAPHHLEAANNLLLVQALDNPRMIEPSIERLENQMIPEFGRAAILLDTLGVLRLLQGDAPGARAVLQEAVRASAGDPVSYLHLAEACHRSGEDGMGRFTLQLAESRGLHRAPLPPRERRVLQELRQVYQEVTP